MLDAPHLALDALDLALVFHGVLSLALAIEYFTKWIEAELVAQIMAHKIQHFVWKNIVCRLGVPKGLVSDNGTQFPSQQLGKLCTKVGIKQVFASVEHPQTNGQVESAN